jgi:hypothetical protein
MLTMTAEPAPARTASLRQRTGGFLTDMVILAAIAMVITVISGAILLFRTDMAEGDPSDADLYLFLGIIGIGVPLVWTILNVTLLATRGQSGGQYVAGLRIEREDGRQLQLATAAAWWFAFNPLLFNWLMAAITGFPLSAVVFLAVSNFTIFVTLALVILHILAPIIALLSAALDAQNRTLYDRIAGVGAVPVDDE